MSAEIRDYLPLLVIHPSPENFLQKKVDVRLPFRNPQDSVLPGNRIDPEAVITIVDTVPILFVDMDSMEPLTILQAGRTPVYPSEIGPALKAWADNQKAKMIQGKEMKDILLYVAIVAAIAAAAISFQNMQHLESLI